MPDAVIVATARSPIGRTREGSRVHVRLDAVAVQLLGAAPEHVPAHVTAVERRA